MKVIMIILALFIGTYILIDSNIINLEEVKTFGSGAIDFGINLLEKVKGVFTNETT